MLQRDSLLAVQWLSATHMNFPPKLIFLILDCTWTIHLRHVWWKANFCPNRLASWRSKEPEQEILYELAQPFCWTTSFETLWASLRPNMTFLSV